MTVERSWIIDPDDWNSRVVTALDYLCGLARTWDIHYDGVPLKYIIPREGSIRTEEEKIVFFTDHPQTEKAWYDVLSRFILVEFRPAFDGADTRYQMYSTQ